MRRVRGDTLEVEGGALPLFDDPRPTTEDRTRLGRQLEAVRAFMEGRGWQTLAGIREATGFPEASISARLRELRAEGYVVERRREGRGLWRYRVSRVSA